MMSLSDLKDIQNTDNHPNHDKVLKLARQLKIDPISIGDYKGMMTLKNQIGNILSDIMKEDGFNYRKATDKIDRIFISSGMDKESAKQLRKGMIQGLMATTNNPKLRKKDFDELIEGYQHDIKKDPLNIETYISFTGFLIANRDIYLKLYNKKSYDLALDVAYRGLFSTLENVTIDNVQKNPSYYSNHFYLMNEYIDIKSLIYESNYIDGDNRFNQLLYEINAKDKLRDVLLEPNKDLSLLSYFLIIMTLKNY